MLAAGPPITCTGRAATRSRAVAVAVTALATLLLSAAGVTGARAPVVPLSADKRADRSRIRFKVRVTLASGQRPIGRNS